jgi:hypothetical protein
MLGEGVERVLAKWMTVPKTNFLGGNCVSSCQFKNSYCKPENYILKIICLEVDGFEHSFAVILCSPLALVKV